MFSFGVTKRLNQETDQLTGYSIPVDLWEKDSQPSESEKAFFHALNKVTQFCQKHREDELGPDLASCLSNSLYRKQVEYTDKRGKTKKKKDESKKILSLFRTQGNDKVNPFDYLNQYCKVKMALIIESIYISKNIVSIQIKVHDAYIKPLKPREALKN